MAIMLEMRTLRGKPENGVAGASLGIVVNQGARVEVISELPPRFIEIQAPDLPGRPVGWVTTTAVDKTAMDVPPIDNETIAMAIATHAEIYGVSAHFLLAYAHMRTAFTPGMMANGVEHGPFSLSASEWAYYGDRADLGAEFPPEALGEWRSQSLVSALRLMLVQNILADKLGRLPNSAELTLALVCGPIAATSGISEPAHKVENLITSASADSPDWAGVDVANIPSRFAEFVTDKTISETLAAISAALQSSLDATRDMIDVSGLTPDSGPEEISDAQEPVTRFSGDATGKLIEISDTDLDALARVANSEVGHFGKYGQDQLRGGLAGVVDTIFNRVAHKSFPDSIQRVVDQRKQFSAINSLHTWTKLVVAPPKISQIVHEHVAKRATGEASIINGATHFLNPFHSSKSAMRNWGQFVVDHAVAKFGNEDKEDIHYHGTPPGTGKPREYVLQRAGQAFQFTSHGAPVAQPQRIAIPSIVTGGSRAATISERIVENALTEWKFFEMGARQESDDPQFRRVGNYWRSVGEDFDGRTLIPGNKPGELINPPWSSAFISHIVKASGAGDRFKYAQAHAIYVQDFVSGRPNGLYEAERPETYAPQPGDLVHAGREDAIRLDFDAAREAFKSNKRYSSHSDIVVEVRSTERILVTVGGNVSQSVSQKRLKLNADGTLKNRRDKHGILPWIAVLRCLD